MSSNLLHYSHICIICFGTKILLLLLHGRNTVVEIVPYMLPFHLLGWEFGDKEINYRKKNYV